MKDRYDVSHLPEGQCEPGSRGLVLKNLLGIKNRREIEALETERYIRTLDVCAHRYHEHHRFTSQDLREMHYEWLGGIYSWAGNYRQVNISKGNFPFAAAAHIPNLMGDFEKDCLALWTPCRGGSISRDSNALAIVHAEFILIHPFREGNGRLGRMLADLMALQAGFVPLDFSDVKGRRRQHYFSAVQAAMRKNYQPMQQIFEELIRKTMRKYV